jgi:hypothetical protein
MNFNKDAMEQQKQEFDILQRAKDFVRAVEVRRSCDKLSEFYHPDVIQIEYPNWITKKIKIRTLQDLKNASEQGRQVLKEEHYDIVNSYVCDKTVILEIIWKATSAIEIGEMPAGSTMKAFFTQFFEFKDGKIFRQRNYDCFERFDNSEHKNRKDKALNYETTS